MTDVLLGGGCRLQPHQVEAVEWLRDHPKALLAHGTGLGKTVTAIGHILELREAGPAGPILWVTAANLMDQTVSELGRFTPGLQVVAFDHQFAGDEDPDVVVLSYHRVKHFDQITSALGNPSLVVCDEVMAVKSGATLHGHLSKLTETAPRVLVMTATPMEINLMETHNVLRILHLPDLWPAAEFGKRFVHWQDGYVNPTTREWVPPQATGVVHENLPELRDYLGAHMHRRTMADLEADLPVWDASSGIRLVTLTPDQLAAIRRSGRVGGIRAHGRRQSASRFFGEDSALVDEFVNVLVTEFADEPKVIVYCENLEPVRMLRERLELMGLGYRDIHGTKDMRERTRALRDFEQDPSVRVLIGTKVLETGLNIQHCRVLVSLDCSDNPMRERQREGRIQRIGSPHSAVTHVTLVPDIPQARVKLERLRQRELDAAKVLEPLLPLTGRALSGPRRTAGPAVGSGCVRDIGSLSLV